MEYAIIVVILAVIVYMLTRKKKEKPPIENPIDTEDKKEVIVKTVPIEQKVYWIKDGKKEWGRMKYMPQGLQVFDEQGNCTLDVTDNLTRIIGSFKIGQANGQATVTVPVGSRLFVFFRDLTQNSKFRCSIAIKVAGDESSGERIISWATKWGKFTQGTEVVIYYGTY